MNLKSLKSYKDEFGKIDKKILTEVESLLPKCKNLALKVLKDEQIGEELILKAAAEVTKQINEENTEVIYVRAYLFKIFRNLVFSKVNTKKRQSELNNKYVQKAKDLIQRDNVSEEERIYRDILINEIECMMDDWTREVTQMRLLGYRFSELVPKYGLKANQIRAKYSRNLQKLVKFFEEK